MTAFAVTGLPRAGAGMGTVWVAVGCEAPCPSKSKELNYKVNKHQAPEETAFECSCPCH